MFKWPWTKETADKKEVDLNNPPTPVEVLDESKDFRIVMPVIVTVPIHPIETFSERVIREYDIQQTALRKKVRSSIFQPLSNKQLRIYPQEIGAKKN